MHKVTHFSGIPHGNEGQPILWVRPQSLRDYEFPAANRPIITAINLPQRLLITGEFIDASDFLKRVELALKSGIRLVQLRVPQVETLFTIVEDATELCKSYSAKLLINTTPELFSKISIEQNIGLHLNSKNLLVCDTRPVNVEVFLSASCHDAKEIEHAQKIGVDVICVSPVLETESHPNQQAMGWDAFEQLLEKATIPAYALGGMKESDLIIALERGAQGVAAISEWW